MKRIFVDYTRIGRAETGRQFRTRLFGSERDGLVPGVVVIAEGDSVPDREAVFVEFVDDQKALFTFREVVTGDASGDDLAEMDRAWGDEMVRRSAQIASGEVEAVTWDEVVAQVAEHRRPRPEAP